MRPASRIVLASGSAIRQTLLRGAGVAFDVARPDIDESIIKDQGLAAGDELETIAMALAQAKAMAVPALADQYVIGSDQILEFDGQAFDKPVDMPAARERLMLMQGKSHSLINATVVRRGDAIVWRNISRPRLTMRALNGAQIDAYLDIAGPDILSSVAAYQFERFGAALFKDVDGDFFAVLGLALAPLLKFLGDQGVIAGARAGASLKLAGVIGTPIGHSLSPFIHRHWANAANVNGYYMPIEVAPDLASFQHTVHTLSQFGFRGVNVTIPHKENCLATATGSSDQAKRAGAANTLSLDGDVYIAENSDILGFSAMIRGTGSVTDGSTMLLLGAGGAARGCILGALDCGVSKIYVANRTRDRAERLAELSDRITIVDWEDRDAYIDKVDIITNATSLGMKGAPALELSLDKAAAKAIVVDIVYTPLETPLLKAAKDRGLKTIDGLEMLIAQAVPGFKAWFGGNPKIDEGLRTGLLEEMVRRRGSPLKVGLTGSIGMGKTTVAEMFGACGAAVWDADAAVHRLYAPGGDAIDAMREAFPRVIGDDGVDREALSALLIKEPARFKDLEAIVHPLVAADREAFAEDAKRDGAAMVLLDIPLLFENAYQYGLDAVIVVSAPADVQAARVLARPGMTTEKFESILARQTPDIQKRELADFVIETGKPQDQTNADVIALYAHLLATNAS